MGGRELTMDVRESLAHLMLQKLESAIHRIEAAVDSVETLINTCHGVVQALIRPKRPFHISVRRPDAETRPC